MKTYLIRLTPRLLRQRNSVQNVAFFTIRPTFHINPTRKRSSWKTLFKPEEFEKARRFEFHFSVENERVFFKCWPHDNHVINDHEVFSKTYLCEYRGNMLSVCPPHNLLMSLESNQRRSRGYSLFQSVREKPLKPRGWNEIRLVFSNTIKKIWGQNWF